MSTRQPVFNAPGIVIALIAVLVGLHVGRSFLDEQSEARFILSLAFIPARYGMGMTDIPGGDAAAWWSFASHALVHGDYVHLAINSAWLLAFGSMMARRLGGVRLVLLLTVCAACGAAAFLMGNWGQPIPMVGASGAVAGLMGAAFRFFFASLDLGGRAAAGSAHTPRMSLSTALRDRRVVLVTLVWVVINVLMGWGAAGLTDLGGIAWEAHLGGYFAGLLLFDLFDPGPTLEQWRRYEREEPHDL